MTTIVHHAATTRRGEPSRGGVKRAMDLALLAAGAPLWLPLIVLVAALVLTQGGPALHLQWRVGQNGVPFRMVKFRTMVPQANRALRGPPNWRAATAPPLRLTCRCDRG
jgi:lipopolysaccharide/colanic/teichoic acid biosynthesis glycosyltransferase